MIGPRPLIFFISFRLLNAVAAEDVSLFARIGFPHTTPDTDTGRDPANRLLTVRELRQIEEGFANCREALGWEHEAFTMDDGFYKAVHEVFERLYDEGLIYRGKRLVNWDPKLHTAISDLEVENKETNGKMWNLRYPLADGFLVFHFQIRNSSM